MRCKNCGRKLPRNSKFCPECGEKQEYELAEDKRMSFDDDAKDNITDDEKESGFNFEQSDKEDAEIEEKASAMRLKLAIFGGGAIALIAVIVLLAIFISGIVSMISSKTTNGNGANKSGQSEHIETEEEKEARLHSEIDKIFEAFSAGTMSYEEAREKVQKYYSEKLAESYAIEINNKMTEEHLYIEYLEQADEYFDNSAWEDAINAYKTALEHKADDAEAQDGLQRSIEKYKEQIASEIAAAVEKDDYDTALQILNNAITLLPDDADLKAKETEVQDAKAAYLQRLHEEEMRRITAQADELIKKGEWDNALELIKKALKENPDDPILTEKYTYIKNTMPMNLTNVDMYDDSGVVRKRETIKDKQGNSYKNYVRFATTNNAKAKFRLGKAYTKLSLTFFVDKDAKEGKKIMLTIIMDGDIVRQYDRLSENSSSETIELDVTGVQTLEIVTLNTGTSGGGFLYLADTSFKRK